MRTSAIFTAVALLATQALNRPSPTMPEHVWATGRLENGSAMCSATVISRGPKYGMVLSCGHCVAGNIGGHATFRRPDGKACDVVLIDFVPWSEPGKPDLSLFLINAADVAAVAPVPETLPKRANRLIDVIGYPGGNGPEEKRLDSPGTYGQSQWTFRVLDGKIAAGSSGSGVFVDGMLVGVTHGSNTTPMRKERYSQGSGLIGTHVFCTSHPAIVRLLKKNRRHFADAGNPLCPNGQCPPPPPAPPPANDPPPAPIGSEPVPAPAPPPKVELPKADLPKPDPKFSGPIYDGRGPPPLDLRGPHRKAVAIDKLRHATAEERIDEIEQKVAAMQADLAKIMEQIGRPVEPGVRGPPGPTGPPGPAGKDVDPATLKQIQSTLADLQNFRQNLVGQRLAGRVESVSP
ncbi:MAG: trypsin-like serine peptidase [Acidiferrobacteraceae bacterium]